MENREFEIIQQLMEQLEDEMQYGEDELSERLGRKKPDVEVVQIEGELGEPGMEEDMAMGDVEEDPEEKLKNRLMKLRGA